MLELQLLPILITAIVTASGATAGTYALVLKREKAIWEELGKLRDNIEGIKTNYLDRFATVNGNIHTTQTAVMTAINDLERNLRESHHNLAENVTKAIASIEVKIGRQSE